MATFDQAFPKSVEYFNGDELAANVFLTKYALTDPQGSILEETPAVTHRRLAKEFARIEKKYKNSMSEDEIFDLMDHYKYVIAQGSPTSAIGNPYQIMSSSNCFVVPPPVDSYGGILLTDQQLVQIAKRRGGVGFDISQIRPKNAPTSNAAKTSDGIGIFMERYSNSCREVAQNGRRGALLLSLSVHHPDIRTFINIKKDKKKVTGANISIRISDEFMLAVKNDTDVQLRWPCEPSPGTIPVYSEKVNARKIWAEIVDAAWQSAEPGLLFWDTVLRNSPADYYKHLGFGTTSTNPCIRASTPLLTPKGIRPLSEIDVGSIIWSGKQWTTVINKVSTGIKPVFGYKTRAGTFYGTENHRIVQNGKKIEVKDAESIDISIGGLLTSDNLDPQDIVDGLMIGDGTYDKKVESNVLMIGENDQSYFDSEVARLIERNKVYPSSPYSHTVKATITEKLVKTYDREIPSNFYNGDSRTICGFLRGLFSANGSVIESNDKRLKNRPGVRVSLKSSSFKIIESTQSMLSAVGIPSYYTTNKQHEVEFRNGKYDCRESYDLSITTPEGKSRFAKMIGFIQPYKNEKLETLLSIPRSPKASKQPKTSYKIVQVEALGEEPVYDITVDAPEHTYWTGGLLVSNCGEIVLSNYDSCRLMVTNLLSFVNNPFTPAAYFDFKLFDKVVQKAQRLMDDMIDIELECIDRILMKILQDPEAAPIKDTEMHLWQSIRKACVEGRRTGLGMTAVGDAVAAMSLRYGSKESIEFVESVYKQNAISSYTSSILMAQERGAFPVWDINEKDHVFIRKILQELSPTVQTIYHNYGRRNIANNTTAPGGSLSILSQTTSGIENAFMLESVRRKKRNPQDKNFRVDFVDQSGDEWQEFKVYHHQFKKWMEISGKTDVKDSPYYGALTADVDWVQGVELQAAAQRWIDHSISRTTNLPNDVPKSVVGDVYFKAWESGCKGITVYRDGSRSGVIVSKDEAKANKLDTRQAPKRPPALDCDIHHVNVKGKPYTVLVGKLDGTPYEVFGGHPLKDLDKSYKVGKIQKASHGKVKPATYNLIVKNGHEDIIEDIASAFDNPTEGAFTRVLSTALRHGTPVQYLVEQILKGEKDTSMAAFSKVISRVLKHYIADGAKSHGDKVCGSCGQDGMVYQEGCLSCKHCGYSKCG